MTGTTCGDPAGIFQTWTAPSVEQDAARPGRPDHTPQCRQPTARTGGVDSAGRRYSGLELNRRARRLPLSWPAAGAPAISLGDGTSDPSRGAGRTGAVMAVRRTECGPVAPAAAPPGPGSSNHAHADHGERTGRSRCTPSGTARTAGSSRRSGTPSRPLPSPRHLLVGTGTGARQADTGLGSVAPPGSGTDQWSRMRRHPTQTAATRGGIGSEPTRHGAAATDAMASVSVGTDRRAVPGPPAPEPPRPHARSALVGVGEE